MLNVRILTAAIWECHTDFSISTRSLYKTISIRLFDTRRKNLINISPKSRDTSDKLICNQRTIYFCWLTETTERHN